MGLEFLLMRLLLVLIFVRTSFAKLFSVAGTRGMLRDYGVPTALVAPLAILFPFVLLAIAIALIPISTAWWAALAICVLYLLPVIGIGYNLVRKRDSLGQLHKRVGGWSVLGRNLVLVAIASFMVWQGQQGIGPGLLDWLALLTMTQRIGLLVSVILSVFVLLEGWVQFHALSQQGRMLLRIEALEGQVAADNVENLDASAIEGQAGLTVDSPAPFLSPALVAAGNATFMPLASMESATTPSTPASGDIELTIGMATYNDFDGVYFTGPPALPRLREYRNLGD